MTQETAAVQVLSRDDIRAMIFSAENSRCKRVEVSFNGTKIELKQPTIDEVNNLNERPEASSRVAMILIKHAYIPGTDTHVFEDADYDALAALPYSPELTELQEVFTAFLVGDTKDAEKN